MPLNVYFTSVPHFVKTRWNKAQGGPIMGSYVYGMDVFDAILRYGRCERVLFPAVSSPADLSVLTDNERRRVRFISDAEFVEIGESEHLVVASSGISLIEGFRRRRIAGNPGIPVTGVTHSLNHDEHIGTLFRMLGAQSEPHDAVICSSRCGQQALSRLCESVERDLAAMGVPDPYRKFQLPLIPLGICVDRFNRDNAQDYEHSDLPLNSLPAPVVLYIGRLSQESKADLAPLLIAFSRVVKEYGRASLILAGGDPGGSGAHYLSSVAALLGIADHVRILSNVTDTERVTLLRFADIFVMPADNTQETFCLSVAEAMASGLPVVAADWDGLKDSVIHGETGFLVKTALPSFPPLFDYLRGLGHMNEPDLLAATTVIDMEELTSYLGQLVINPQLRARFGIAGQRRASSEFDWPVIIKRYDALWEQLLIQAKCSSGSPALPFNGTGYSYLHVFEGYASTQVLRTLAVRTTPAGDACVEGSGVDVSLALGKHAMFDRQMLWETLNQIYEAKHIQISHLIGHQELSPIRECTRIAHVCRLLKYGLIAMAEF